MMGRDHWAGNGECGGNGAWAENGEGSGNGGGYVNGSSASGSFDLGAKVERDQEQMVRKQLARVSNSI